MPSLNRCSERARKSSSPWRPQSCRNSFSPFATVVLMINRVGGIPTRTLTWGWNFGYSVLAAAVLFAVFFVLTGGR